MLDLLSWFKSLTSLCEAGEGIELKCATVGLARLLDGFTVSIREHGTTGRLRCDHAKSGLVTVPDLKVEQ
jgi:hypothetical protein